MRNLQSFVDFMIRNHSKQKRYIMLTATLSVLVMFAVGIVLAKPADSMTGQLVCEYEAHIHEETCYQLLCDDTHEHTDECYSLICQTDEHIHSQDCYESIPSEYISTYCNSNITLLDESEKEYFTEIPTKIPDNALCVNPHIYNSAALPTQLISQGYDVEDNKDAKFKISFQLPQSVIANITAEKPYLYYKLPEGVKFNEESKGSSNTVIDSEMNNVCSAYYSFTNSIDGESYIVFRVCEEYITQYLSKGTHYNCTISFDSKVSRNPNTNSGDREVDLGYNVKPIITFTDYTPVIHKAGSNVQADANGNLYAEWTITITNKAPKTDLSTFTLDDDMFENIIKDSLVVEPDASYFDLENRKILKDIDKTDGVLKIKYHTPVDVTATYIDNYKTIPNKAILTNTLDNTEKYEAPASSNISMGANISKSVKNDYSNGVGTSAINNCNIWTIDLSSTYNMNLANYKVYDEAFKSDISNLVITDQDGKTITNTDTDIYYTLNKAEGKIEFSNKITAKSLKITYSTSRAGLTNQDKVVNTATVYYPNDTKGLTSYQAESSTYTPYKFSKSGKYEKDTLTWTLNIENDYSLDVNINGLKVYDECFKSLSKDSEGNLVKFDVTGIYKNWSQNPSITYEEHFSEGYIILKSSSPDGAHCAAYGAKITMAVDLTSDQKAKIDAFETANFTNTATIRSGTSYEEQATYSFSYNPSNKVSKSIITKGLSETFEMKQLKTEKQKILEWSVDMVQSSGYSNNSKIFVDVMEAKDLTTKNPSTEADHYLTPSQRSDIVVYAQKTEEDNWTDTPIDSANYTITYYKDKNRTEVATAEDNARSFSITFSDYFDKNNYECVRIKYKTTADFENVSSAGKITFNNKAEFNKNSSSPQDSYTINVYDKTNPPYHKYAVGYSSLDDISNTEVDLKNVTKATISGTEYYIFRWHINIDQLSDSMEFVDTFDEGFTLCTEEPYNPKHKYIYSPQYEALGAGDANTYRVYTYTENANNFSFRYYANDAVSVVYYTKIPVSEFRPKVVDSGETGIEVTNTVIDSKSLYESRSSKIKLTGEDEPTVIIENPIDKSYVPQNGTVTADTGYNNISYVIDVNPKAIDLANGDELLIEDSFITKQFESNYSYGTYYNKETGLNIMDTILHSVKICEVDKNNVETELSKNDFSYQYYDGTQKGTTFSPAKSMLNNYEYLFDGLQEKDTITFIIKGEANTTFTSNEAITIYIKNQWSDIQSIVIHSGSNRISFDKNGEYRYTVTLPANCVKASVYSNDINNGLIDADATVVRQTTTSELNLIVPDAKHLRIYYTYKILKDGLKPEEDARLTFNNNVTLTGTNSYTDTPDDTVLTFKYGAAEGSTDYLPRIQKLDVGDHTIEGLNASFNFARYDSTNFKWQWYASPLSSAIGIKNDQWSDNREDAVKIQTVDSFFEFQGLVDGELYALVETDEPTHQNYEYEDASKVPVCYFSHTSTPTTIPTGVNGETIKVTDIETIPKNGVLPITNIRYIDVSVEKEWDEKPDNASVEVELYWSYTKKLSGFPANLTLATADDLNIKDPATFTNKVTITDNYTWSGLPNGIGSKPIYYYVKETAYTIDNVKYTATTSGKFKSESGIIKEYLPVYTGNAVSQTGTPILITNAKSLKIEKQWTDNRNLALPSTYIPVDEVQFKIWGREEEASDLSVIRDTNGSNLFTIKKSDNWVLEFDTDLLGNYKYFEVQEVTPLDGFTTSYNMKYVEQTGSIIIINKNSSVDTPMSTITVEKTWLDNGSANRPNDITLQLMSSTDKTTWTNVEMTQPTADVNGDVWTYVYNNLPYRNDNGDILYYKVSETVPGGYKLLSAINNEGIDSGTIKLTNVKTLKLTMKKSWSDIQKNNHLSDPINVNVYRSINALDIANTFNDTTLYKENVTISNTSNWETVINDCEAYNENGEKYYYWIKEIEVPGYTVSYSYSNASGNSISLDDGIIAIHNDYIYPPVTLPATGGTGTTMIYISGFVIIAAASLYIILKNRKQNNKRHK